MTHINVYRTSDYDKVEQTLSTLSKYVQDSFDIKEWAESNKDNVILRAGEDFALFDFESDGLYQGHYLFENARGADAVELASEMINTMFLEYNARVIKGLVPSDNKAAIWLSRKIGFVSLGKVETLNGECELFFLSSNNRSNDAWVS